MPANRRSGRLSWEEQEEIQRVVVIKTELEES